ncbi:hypothetical protein E3N88_43550 [Mikania micrantha]|uniref:Uncharacterized protein n=1 Tax=Mikania micrantha TaxID=192012 RepID=A0A5N6LEN0_9ASTR|nr:hypothetical protein E3N88_43550 [Mikania micrantha]
MHQGRGSEENEKEEGGGGGVVEETRRLRKRQLTIEIGSDRFKTPDVLFNPSLIKTIPGMEGSIDIAAAARGLPQMVIESINKCDVDIRRELFSSILESPQAARVKVLASGNSTERRFR